jgi:hypothetical protein
MSGANPVVHGYLQTARPVFSVPSNSQSLGYHAPGLPWQKQAVHRQQGMPTLQRWRARKAAV